MIFWDSSAILPLLINEIHSDRQTKLFEEKGEILIWTLTPVEVVSALARLVRERKLDTEGFEKTVQAFHVLAKNLRLVKDVESVKVRAFRLLPHHHLRAADAMQLAAALIGCADQPSGHRFVTFDGRLAAAARAEGFEVLN